MRQRFQCTSPSSQQFEVDKLEYTELCAEHRSRSQLRRWMMIFVTAVQGGILGIMSPNWFREPDEKDLVLAVMASLVAVIGFSQDWALRVFMNAYERRAREIELGHRMKLWRDSLDHVKKERATAPLLGLSAAYYFRSYYGLIALFWASYIVYHVMDRLQPRPTLLWIGPW